MASCMFLECLKKSMSVKDRCCQRSMVQVRHVIEDISNDQYKIYLRLWTRLAKKVYDDVVGIQWRWPSLDSSSISIKASLARND